MPIIRMSEWRTSKEQFVLNFPFYFNYTISMCGVVIPTTKSILLVVSQVPNERTDVYDAKNCSRSMYSHVQDQQYITEIRN